MTALVNKIYMSGDWPKEFLDVTDITKEKPRRNAATTEQFVSFTHWKDCCAYPK